MDDQPKIEDVLRKLNARGVRCGLVRLGDEVIGAWLDDDAFVDGSYFAGDTPEMLNEIVRWLRKTAGEEVLARSDNVIDARRRFAKR